MYIETVWSDKGLDYVDGRWMAGSGWVAVVHHSEEDDRVLWTSPICRHKTDAIECARVYIRSH